MSKNHFPGANVTSQYWAGKFRGSTMDTNCVCIHTTETSTWPGYGGGASAPHMTIRPNIAAKTVDIRQHFPAGKSSRALVNLTGGVETNTLNVFQIELIGTCDSRYRERRKEWGVAGVDYIYWPDAPDWLLAAIAPVFRWLDAEWPRFNPVDATPRGWVQYPSSYGINAKQRMTFAEWRGAYGIFGHQHVPENTHGDPGDFPADRLVAIIAGTVTPPADPPVPPEPSVAVWGKPDTWKLGATGPDVTRLGERIVVWSDHYGLPTPYKVGPGPVFTETDVKALSAVQVAFGYGNKPADLKKGGNSDGYPGTQTFKDLAADPAPRFTSSVLIQTCASRRSDAAVGGSWNRRYPILANVFLRSEASFIVCTELYAAQRPDLSKAIASKYAEAAVAGGRVLYYRKGRWGSSTGFWWKYLNGKTKPCVVDFFINNENKSKLTVSAWHTTWQVTTAGSAARKKEVTAGMKWIEGLKINYGPHIPAGDFNSPADNGSRRPMGDDVEPVMEAFGYHDLEDDHEVANGPGNYHLERAFGDNTVHGERIKIIRHDGADRDATYVEFSYS